MKIVIKNDKTDRSTLVETDNPLYPRRVVEIRNRLCLRGIGGDILGAAGPQPDQAAYDAFKARAEVVEATRQAESGDVPRRKNGRLR